jgi:hypothetical protein
MSQRPSGQKSGWLGKKTGARQCPNRCGWNRVQSTRFGKPNTRGMKKRRKTMETQDFLRILNEFDFILDDIDEISGQLDLTKTENNKMSQAISQIEKSKKILIELFPNIQSLDHDVREDLEAELMDIE